MVSVSASSTTTTVTVRSGNTSSSATTSTNPVQNKVITSALDEKVDLTSSQTISGVKTFTANQLYINSEVHFQKSGSPTDYAYGTAVDLFSNKSMIGTLYIGGTFIKQQKNQETLTWTLPNNKSGTIALTDDIPTATSDLTNDSGFITSSSLPTKTSDLTNDSGYITSSAVGDGTITFTQGGVTKGSITTNQSGNTTIALDAGGGTVDQTYSSTSINAQSGAAIAGAGFLTSSALSGYQTTGNLVTSLSSSSTDTQYPSAKCVYDLVGDIETLLAAI